MSLPHDGPPDSRLVSLLWIEPDRVDEIADMHAQLFDLPWSAESIRGLITHPGSTALVCKVRTAPDAPPCPSGFVLGRVASDEAEIITLGVLPRFQRCGLARKLLEGAIQAFGTAGVKRVFLEVAHDNNPALALYRSEGFVEVARRKRYYERKGASAADAVVMSRAI